jgi:lipoprotein-anchoring transpeptidase ErfK/SrfK
VKAALVTGAAVVVLAGAPAGMYAYDSSRSDVIAAGVAIGGIDVGGLPLDRARGVVERRLAAPLQRPLVLRHRSDKLVLTPEAASVSVDVEAMLRVALAVSRHGNFLNRAWRDLTGRRTVVRVPLRVAFSGSAVAATVARLERALERPARDGRAIVSATSLRVIPSRDGLAVRADALRRTIGAALVRPEAARTIEVPTRTVRPKVTTGELAAQYGHFIGVSRRRFELRLFERLKLVKVYRISVGRIGYDTPAGLYRIKSKAENPSWWVPNRAWAGALAGKVIPPGPENPIKARWLGVYDGVGVHGTAEADSIGRRASRGCIRMRIPDVIELYERVPVGTPIYIG